MKKITIKDVRTVLANMGNTYVSLFTNEELSAASLQDDLGMENNDILEFVSRLENVGHFFICESAKYFLRHTNSIPVYLLRRIFKEYACESKPCYS